jgi:hypothetical protein
LMIEGHQIPLKLSLSTRAPRAPPLA